MGKISQISSKYIIHSTIEIEGVVDRPDVIGAIFGQTEGLLGSDLELRELQRSGRIGRIEVNVDTKLGKTKGEIIIPSSLDKAETAIVGSALEIIQRIGPCNARIRVGSIEDVRISKRTQVIERAKELLKEMMDATMPDSQELADEVAQSVRIMECVEYGKNRLPAGPAIDESDEVIIVEGRADVINLLKNGIKNAIALNGTSVPDGIIELCKRKTVTVFVDGDRGGDLIIKELMGVAEIDFVTKAPDGKEVEELAKKEIHKALRSKIAIEQVRLDVSERGSDDRIKPLMGQRREQTRESQRPMQQQTQRPMQAPPRIGGMTTAPTSAPAPRPLERSSLTDKEKDVFRNITEDLIGTRGACLLDEKLNVLGKVPFSEVSATLKSMTSGVYALLFDGTLDKELAKAAERANIRHVVAMDTKVKTGEVRVNIWTVENL